MKTRIGIALCMLTSMVLALSAQGQRPAGITAGKARVTDAYGTAQKRFGDPKAPWQNLNVGDLLLPQTMVRTGDQSAALLQLPDGHIFRLGENTTVELRALGQDRTFSFRVLSGNIWSSVRTATRPAKYEIETPSAVVGVSGTIFSVFHDPTTAQTQVSVNEGNVTVSRGQNTLGVGSGLCASIGPGQPWPTQALPQPPQLRRMWRLLRQKEGWTGRGRAGRLSRELKGPFHVLVRQSWRHARALGPRIGRMRPNRIPHLPHPGMPHPAPGNRRATGHMPRMPHPAPRDTRANGVQGPQ